MTRFDILLVLGYFRSAAAYLSIIRHLSPQFRIGVMAMETDPSLRKKTGQAEAVFLRLCTEFGAALVDASAKVATTLMIVQQFPYTDDQVSAIDASVTAERRVGLMTLAMAGVDKFDEFLGRFGISRIYVPSRRFMNFLVEKRHAQHRYENIDVEEVGLPFAAYPVFPEFRVDWLIAAPTLFSFSTEGDKQAFLTCVLDLMAQIPEGDVVAYKPHNGNELDYFVPSVYYPLAAVFERIPSGEALLTRLSRLGPVRLRRHFDRTLTSMLHRKVLRRALPLNTLTRCSEIALEPFLPGVRKGVIGGLSNTIWGTLYFKLPFFNCVDPALMHHGPSELLNKSSAALLKVNLEYFGVPYCAAEINRGVSGEDIVRDSDREGDLLAAIRADLEAVS